jgi:hypothetical protein
VAKAVGPPRQEYDNTWPAARQAAGVLLGEVSKQCWQENRVDPVPRRDTYGHDR